ncbi:HD-GYP domain-containing protein [Bacillus sp. M6-12]|uniref:HD-GYP domain-containing protein n=1 Tax=Bacillus sp. M6-12 TaxID=2054166 RepID=UPI002155B085|nr:HD-GYP domain-containing protein [Bacillus sp. M6-12]
MEGDKRLERLGEMAPLTAEEIDQILLELREKKAEQKIELQALPETPYQPEKLEAIGQKIKEATNQIGEIFLYIRGNGKVPIEQITDVIVPTIEEAAEIPHLYFLFKELYSKDEYTYRHTICVGVISAAIGRWIGLSPKELKELTLAAVLHDIGKTRIPESILQKPGKLTAEEFKEMKLHTVYGYELLRQIPGLPVTIPLTALQHHEREDGKGYPIGLKGFNTHLYSKIVAIADVFHAMSSDRIYHDALPFYQIMKGMHDDMFGKFDPNIILIFLNHMMAGMVGNKVLLSNGMEGTMIMVNPYDPINSLVKVGNSIHDLSKEKGIGIERVY